MIAIEPKHWLGLNGMTMKYKFTGIALGLAVAAGAQAQQFIQIANYNLGTIGANQQVNDIAFDGTDLYVGLANTTGSPTTASFSVTVKRVADALNPATPTQQVGTDVITRTLNTFGQRGTRLSVAGGALYFGYGLGAASGSGGMGIERYTISGGTLTQDTSFGGDGIVNTGAEIDVPGGPGIPARLDAFDVDTDGNLGIVAFGSGGVFKINSSGVAQPTVVFSPASIPSTAWRDVAFGQNGQVFARVPHVGTAGTLANLTRYDRVDSVTLGNTANLVASSVTGFSASWNNVVSTLNNVGPSGNWSFVAANGIASNQVYVSLQDGSWSGTLTGTENGLGSAFTSNNFALGTGQAGGRNFLFVGTTAGNVRVYEMVPEPASMIAVGVGAAALLRRRKKTA